jgi:hypothetical protein
MNISAEWVKEEMNRKREREGKNKRKTKFMWMRSTQYMCTYTYTRHYNSKTLYEHVFRSFFLFFRMTYIYTLYERVYWWGGVSIAFTSKLNLADSSGAAYIFRAWLQKSLFHVGDCARVCVEIMLHHHQRIYLGQIEHWWACKSISQFKMCRKILALNVNFVGHVCWFQTFSKLVINRAWDACMA